jgi:BirA family biotin operon repressor/biotin-[acetyl-CoA-carboxylase] ligase
LSDLAPEALLSELLNRQPDAVARTAAAASTWKELERRGYELQGSEAVCLQGDGWFHPGRFQEHWRSQLGRRLHTWAVTDSTNDRAHAAAHGTQAHGAVWVAEEQTDGRGRQGRRWLAARFSSLLFSVSLPVNLRKSPAPQLLPLALGLGVCESLRRMTGAAVQVRWPNDLMLQDHKLGGMLLEARGAGVPRTVVGIGLNLSTPVGHLHKMGLPQAASLSTHRQVPGREVLLADILSQIETRMHDWQADKLADIVTAWRQHDCLRGRRVQVQTERQQHAGEVLGIDADGLLELRAESGAVHRFTAAEVHIL